MTPVRSVNVFPLASTTAPSLTRTSTVAVLPSTSAVTLAVPIATPVTSPAATVTLDWSEVDQVVMRSTSVAPCASFGTATSIWVPPGTMSIGGTGLIATVATGAGGDVPSVQPSPIANAPIAAMANRRALRGDWTKCERTARIKPCGVECGNWGISEG